MGRAVLGRILDLCRGVRVEQQISFQRPAPWVLPPRGAHCLKQEDARDGCNVCEVLFGNCQSIPTALTWRPHERLSVARTLEFRTIEYCIFWTQ